MLFVQKGLEAAPEVLIDPNTWSSDGTVRLVEFAPSRDARHAVYAVSKSGSDWLEYRVIDLETKETLPDTIEWVKVSSAAWRGDGFYYSRYPAPPPGKELSSSNEHHRVFYHRLGTSQDADELVFEDPASPLRFHLMETTEDERFEMLVRLTIALRARRETPCSCAIDRARRALRAAHCRPSHTTHFMSSTTSAASCWSTPIRTRPMAASSGSIRTIPLRAIGRLSWRRG